MKKKQKPVLGRPRVSELPLVRRVVYLRVDQVQRMKLMHASETVRYALDAYLSKKGKR